MSELIDLYMIRHAPVINSAGLIYGDEADVDLQNHLDRLAELASRLPSSRESLWFHSGVQRTILTAQAILDVLSEEHDHLESHEGFKEQNFGDLIGQNIQDIDGHLHLADEKIFAPNPPNGESIGNLRKRVLDSLENVFEIAKNRQINKVVIFTHGGTIRAARLIIEKLPLKEFINFRTPPLCLYNP